MDSKDICRMWCVIVICAAITATCCTTAWQYKQVVAIKHGLVWVGESSANSAGRWLRQEGLK